MAQDATCSDLFDAVLAVVTKSRLLNDEEEFKGAPEAQARLNFRIRAIDDAGRNEFLKVREVSMALLDLESFDTVSAG